MKIEMEINEISSKVLSKVKSQLPYPPLNLKEYWKIIKRFGRNFHNGLYASLPGFAVKFSYYLTISKCLFHRTKSNKQRGKSVKLTEGQGKKGII